MSLFGDEFDFIGTSVDIKRPSFTPTQREVLDLIYGPINTDHQPFELDDLSPTPLDANALMTDAGPYNPAAIALMTGRLDGREDELGITLADYQKGAISEAIVANHHMRVAQNQAAHHRGVQAFLKDPSSISPSLGEKFLAVRKAEASTIEKFQTFVGIRALRAFEIHKFTRPLHPEAMAEGHRTALQRLRQARFENDDLDFRVLSDEEKRAGRRYVMLGGLASFGCVQTKQPIIEGEYQGVPFVIKERQSFQLFSPETDLGTVTPTIRPLKVRGETVYANVQEMDFSHYVAAPGREEEMGELESANMADTLVVNRGLGADFVASFNR